MIISDKFPRYTEYEPKVPVYCVTPNKGGVLHRFFDSSPFSPSGRYMALFRLPVEDELNNPGDFGEIVLVDLQEGTEKVVATSYGYEPQMGANINWGSDDDHILYNDVDINTWEVFGVELNHKTGEKRRFEKGVYHASLDGKLASTGNPACKYKTQPGYGVIIPKELVPSVNILSEDEGLFITDIKSGKSKLLLSMKDIFTTCFDDDYIQEYKEGECYLFHSKFSPSGKKIMFSTRYIPKQYIGEWDPNYKKHLRFNVFTCNLDGSNLQVSIGEEHWVNGGHHTTFHHDEEHLTMNIRKDWGGLKFAMATLDGKNVYKVFENTPGSGHPTFHPSGKFIITDTYTTEPTAYGDGTIPIRVVYLEDGSEEAVVRINTEMPAREKEATLRIDPHPAWDLTNRYVAINAAHDGTRRVYVLDMKEYI